MKEGAARTVSQGFCLFGGLALIAWGILGLIFGSSSFGSGDDLASGNLLFFEMNGWQNVLHLAAGALLLLAAPKPALAASGALAVGILYAVFAVWGFIAGDNVANLIAVDTDANILSAAIAGAAVFAGVTGGALQAAARRDAKKHGGHGGATQGR